IGKHLKPLCRQLKTKRTEARNVTAWSGQAVDEAVADRIADYRKDDRDRRSRLLSGDRRYGAGASDDYIDLAGNEIRRQAGQTIVLAFCPPVFDRNIPPIDVASFTQPVAEGSDDGRTSLSGQGVQPADYRHRLMLCTQGARHGQCAA